MKVSVALGGLLALLLACAADVVAQTPPLGDVARKEAERRKTVKSAGKVITNDNLRREAPPIAAAPPPPATPTPASSPEAAAPWTPALAAPTPAVTTAPAQPAPDQAAWGQRISAARDALSRSQIFADALQSRI